MYSLHNESDSDSDGSSSSDNEFSMTRELLENPMEEDNLNTTLTHSMLQVLTVHVPFTVAKCIHRDLKPRRRYIRRDRRECHDLIISDYFSDERSKYTPVQFRRRFRMNVSLFKRILGEIQCFDNYFTQKVDAVGNYGLNPLQKMIAVVRMLAYGCATDSLDEYVQIRETTAIESLKHFCDAIIGIFGGYYLRKPNQNDLHLLLKEGEARGFPSMLGSLDCMHWHWKNCPIAWHGTHTNGFKRVPTLILEIVALRNLWIWHAFFGMAGTHNDISVLDHSLLFDDIVNEVAPPCNFTVNGHHYNMGYYLSDGIYPSYATLIQTISQPSSMKEKTFAKHHEAVRKDVERASGVLKSRWHIIKGPARMWSAEDLRKIMITCIILHNMIVESEQGQDIDLENWQDPEDEVSKKIIVEHDYNYRVSRMIGRLKQVQDTQLHKDLKSDLVSHLWDVYGDTGSVL